jgi:amidohydrolase
MGPTIALRACLDALAMDERSGVDYASENVGVFHGCGHDGNMTMVLGAANILAQYRQQLKGNVKFIFQPAEEETGGAAEIIKAGGLEDPTVDAIITLHNWHGLKEGVLSVQPGPVLASSDVFHLDIIGKPGHGAYPHLAVDPIVTAAHVISALQNIVSRNRSHENVRHHHRHDPRRYSSKCYTGNRCHPRDSSHL